jgi:glycolate oxidase FAD binding subunit
VNLALALHKQWLPLDPAFAGEATIGGILATNDAGPLRHRFGTPRDLVIGTQIATADGVLAQSGGQVVKNVAGYDLSKLLAGSFGGLAVIVSATFKLSPLPAQSQTLVSAARDADELAAFVQAVMASQLEPIAFDVHVPSFSLLVRFASVPAAVEAQATAARLLLGAARVLEGDGERALWQLHHDRIWAGTGAVVRASWLPARLAQAIALVKSCAALTGIHGVEMAGRAAIGAGFIRIDGDPPAQARAIGRLRESEAVGNVVVLKASDDLKTLVDVWGTSGDRGAVFASLKRAFDPAGILNAGRGPM